MAKNRRSIEETLRAAREGVIDDSILRARPDADTLEAIRADLEQFEANYRAERQTAAQARTTRRTA